MFKINDFEESTDVAQEAQEKLEKMLRSDKNKRKTLKWAMTGDSNEPKFLCTAQPPYALEHANAAWCKLTGFTPLMIKGSYGLEILKGPLTDEDVVAKAWDTSEKRITVIHYTGGGTLVNHTVQIIPLLDEKSDKITHYLGISSFEKYVGRGHLFHRVRKVVDVQAMSFCIRGPPPTANALANLLDRPAEAAKGEGKKVADEGAKASEVKAAKGERKDKKNIYVLRKENALRNLEEYSLKLSESVRTQVPLQLVEKKEEEETDNKNTNKKSLKGMSDTADRLNAWKTRLHAAKRLAKKEQHKDKLLDPENLSANAESSSSRPQTVFSSCDPPPGV